jgi:cytochrome c oxidase subunit 2
MLGTPALAGAFLGAAVVAILSPGDAPAGRQSQEPRVIEVVAKRYVFEPSEIEVVAGAPVRLMVRSGDGLHGFAIRQFKIQETIQRGGAAVAIDFTPSEPGRFPILCSEFCGNGHDDMKGTLVVTAPAPQP